MPIACVEEPIRPLCSCGHWISEILAIENGRPKFGCWEKEGNGCPNFHCWGKERSWGAVFWGRPCCQGSRPGPWAPALGFRASCPDSRPSPTHLVFTCSCKVLTWKKLGQNSYYIWRQPYICEHPGFLHLGGILHVLLLQKGRDVVQECEGS